MSLKSNKWGITKEFLEKEYFQKKNSLLVISKKTSIPYETLYYYLKKFNLPTISSSEFMTGRRNSKSTEFKANSVPWNKGKTKVQVAWNKGKNLNLAYRKKISKSTKKAMANPTIKSKISKTQFKKGFQPWNKNKKGVYSQETIEKIKKARLIQKFPKKDTSIELILFNLLDDLSINYRRHFPIETICQVDVFIEPNMVIFADGDYWHANPKFYSTSLTKAQIVNRTRDRKVNKELIQKGYVVLRLWEVDLLNNPTGCLQLIKKFTKHR